jgi:CDI toxin RNase A-like protein
VRALKGMRFSGPPYAAARIAAAAPKLSVARSRAEGEWRALFARNTRVPGAAPEIRRVGKGAPLRAVPTRASVTSIARPRGHGAFGAFTHPTQLRKYRPDQPRVPAGNPDGGQWTGDGGGGRITANIGAQRPTGGGGAGGDDPRVISDATPDNTWKPGARYAQGDRLQGFPTDLRENQHVLEQHVRSRNYVLQRAQEIADAAARKGDRFVGLVPAGSFSSLESATKLVNSTLAQNQAIVDQVARGTRLRETIEARFSSPTGYEGYVARTHAQPVLRETYGVRVIIGHDRRAAHGYRIITAYPIR